MSECAETRSGTREGEHRILAEGWNDDSGGQGIDRSYLAGRFDKEQELDTVSAEDVSTLLVGCDKISLQLCEFIAKYMDSVDYPKEETLNEIR